MSRAFTIWFTGISHSGKSTVGTGVGEALRARGFTVELLDSGRIRAYTNRSLGFTQREIEANVLRLGYECNLLNRNGVVAVVMAVSPYREVRDQVRKQIEHFVEVYCHCPLDVLRQRDTAELFARAERGEVQHVAGVNAPYEEPLHPEITLDTDRLTPEASIEKVLKKLEELGHIDPVGSANYTASEEEMIRQRLQDLGYL